MKRLICPSMMCANFANLKEEVSHLDRAGVDIFHMDFMDGSFVPNFGIGIQDFELVRKETKKSVDVHLMIEEPGKYVKKFSELGADIIYIHPEADKQPTRTLETIRNMGKKAGIALNPGTSVATIKELLVLCDYVMVMTVNPGFSGQNFLSYTKLKIEELVELKQKYQFQLMVDGAISKEKVKELSVVGVNGFILGTSALFGKKESYQEIINQLKEENL